MRLPSGVVAVRVDLNNCVFQGSVITKTIFGELIRLFKDVSILPWLEGLGRLFPTAWVRGTERAACSRCCCFT